MKIEGMDRLERRIDKLSNVVSKAVAKISKFAYQSDQPEDTLELTQECYSDINGIIWTRLTIDVPMGRVEIEE